MDKLNAVCQNWSNRQLSLTGKVLVINTLMSSLFVYRMTTMLNLSLSQLEVTQTKIVDFLWSGKKPKIARETLYRDYSQGGLRLVNLQAKQSALKINWVFECEHDNVLQSAMYENLHKFLRQLIWKCNINSCDVSKLFPQHTFWRDVLLDWSQINYRNPLSKAQVLDQIIWLNSDVQINDRPVFWKRWYNLGILSVSNIVNQYGTMKSCHELCLQENEWLNCCNIWAALPTNWKKRLSENNYGESYVDRYTQLYADKNRTKTVYNILICNSEMLLKCMYRWSLSDIEFCYEEYSEAFVRFHKCTNITKFRDFFYRMWLNKLVFNVDLKAWGLSNNSLCTFCASADETFCHTLWSCKFVRPLWKWFEHIVNNDRANTVNIKNIIQCRIHETDSNILNFIAIVISQFIYKHRCNNETPNVFTCVSQIRQLYHMDLFEGKSESHQKKVYNKWSPIPYYL